MSTSPQVFGAFLVNASTRFCGRTLKAYLGKNMVDLMIVNAFYPCEYLCDARIMHVMGVPDNIVQIAKLTSAASTPTWRWP